MVEGLIMESLLPAWMTTMLVIGLAVGVAGLGVWLAAKAMESLLRLWRRTLAAELRLQHLKKQTDNAALNYWIRDSFKQKALAAQEKHRADQEAYDKRQIAMGADNYMRMRGLA